MTIRRSSFPAGFAWGTASASYQVEGATDVDGRGRSIWDTFAAVPGAIADGRSGDPADEHYWRFRDDIALMADLGVNAYRFSVAWPRIQPDGTGPAQTTGIDYYRRVCDELLARDITPWVTLYHWDLPQALEERGGWLDPSTAERFGEYAGLVAGALGDVVDRWITLNEPWCSAFLGYGSGIHAPGRRVGSHAARAAHHLMVGHARAARAVRSARVGAQVGLSLNLYSVRPASGAAADVDAARRIDGLANRFFLEPALLGRYPADVLDDLGERAWFEERHEETREIAVPLDFLGINYYSRYVAASPRIGTDAAGEAAGGAFPGSEDVLLVDTGAPRTHVGHAVHPEGLIDVLQLAHDLQPALPLVITENGSSYRDIVVDGDVDDEDRRRYLEQHVLACAAALQQRLPLTGYFAWTLTDNFEWAWGYSRRFGLVHVDFETQRRTVKTSGRWLRAFLRRDVAPQGAADPTQLTKIEQI